MANELDKLSVQLGIELENQELKNSVDELKKQLEKKTFEALDKAGAKAFLGIGEKAADGIKKGKSKVENSAKENVAKPIGSAIKKRVTEALTIATGFLTGRLVEKVLGGIKDATFAAARSAITFEKGIAEVNSILDENQKVTDETTDSILRFSSQFGTSQQRQVRSFYNIVSAGVKGTRDQLATLEVANKAAVAGLVDIDTAAFGLVSAVNAYSNSGLTAARASDILFRGVKEGQLVFRGLAGSIGRVAPIAAEAGISFDQAIGSLVTLTRTGIPVQEAASAIRQLFSTLLKPSSQAQKVLDELNTKTRETIQAQIDLGSITQEEGFARLNKEIITFSKQGIKAAGGLSEFFDNLKNKVGDNSTALNTLFKNIRAFTAVTAITGNLQQFDQILGSIKDSSGATNTAFEILSNTVDFKFNRVKAVISSVGTVLLSTLKEPAKDLLDFFLDVFPKALLGFADVFITIIAIIEAPFRFLGKVVRFAFQGIKATIFAGLTAIAAGLSKTLQFVGSFVPGFDSKMKDIISSLENATGEFRRISEESQDFFGKEFSGVLKLGYTEAAQSVRDKLAEILTDQDTFTREMKKKLEELAREAGKTGEKVNSSLERQQAAFDSAFSSGISNTIQNLVTAVKDGQNLLDALFSNFLLTVADMAIKVGEVVVAVGIAKLKLLGTPFETIAAGAGLIAIGSILKAFAGGGGEGATGAAAGAGGGAGGVGVTETLPEELEPEEQVPSTVVNLNVEGSIFDSDNTARRLADLLNAGFDNENITLKQGL